MDGNRQARVTLAWFLLTVCLQRQVASQDCYNSFGVESRWLDDQAFTASTFASLANDPSRARLHLEEAWVPANDDSNPLIQIQLKSEANVSGIALQGHPVKEFWVKKFLIQYSKDGKIWQTDPTSYSGSTDQNTVVHVNLTSIVLSQFVRIIPTDWNQRVAIRMEIFGCGQVTPTCGLRGENIHERVRRIVGGQASAQGSWPWMATLETNNTQWCGATLIAPDWIIAGAHCFNEFFLPSDPAKWEVVLGEYEKGKTEEFEQRIQLKEIYYHHKHDYYWPYIEGGLPEYDIALARLTRPAVYTEHVQPICLLNPAVNFKEGNECAITGWGKTNSTAKNSETFLREAFVPIVSLEKCNRNTSYDGRLSESMICAGKEEGGVDSCQFDSGGPLACEDGGHWYQTGIVSFGFGCGDPFFYGVYADMHILTDWVKKMMFYLD